VLLDIAALTALGAVTAHRSEAGLESVTLMRRGNACPPWRRTQP